jgi:hypothetical protein
MLGASPFADVGTWVPAVDIEETEDLGARAGSAASSTASRFPARSTATASMPRSTTASFA